MTARGEHSCPVCELTATSPASLELFDRMICSAYTGEDRELLDRLVGAAMLPPPCAGDLQPADAHASRAGQP